MTNFDYTQLDPNIRQTVEWLHRNNFETSDSGDGKTKQGQMEGVLDFPHVVIAGDMAEAERLCQVLKEQTDIELDNITVEIEYARVMSSGSEHIILSGVTDQMLCGREIQKDDRVRYLGKPKNRINNTEHYLVKEVDEIKGLACLDFGPEWQGYYSLDKLIVVE